MGFHITGADVDYSCSTWGGILSMAYAFNWMPVGAKSCGYLEYREGYEPPNTEDVENEEDSYITYFFNFGQYVKPEDARNIGLALKKAKSASDGSEEFSADEIEFAKSYKGLIYYAQPFADYYLQEDQLGFEIW